MRLDKNQQAFFALVKAGLWEKDVRLLPFGNIDFKIVCSLAEEQSVIGLVAAGLEHVVDFKVPQEVVLQFVGQTLQLEQRNKSMNEFIGHLFDKLDREGIHAILIKGQGIAQCYERPQWRTSGDVDLLLDNENYVKAKFVFEDIASRVGDELIERLHQDYSLGAWEVELHGTFRTGLWKNLDKVIDGVQNIIFLNGGVRYWKNGNNHVPLPNPDDDVIFLFSHIIQHFFKGGIGLRQISDWCRLLWTYKESIDYKLLESRLNKAGLVSEWKAFSSLVVDTLGMPTETMPLYENTDRWRRKSHRILAFIMETGNFGHSRDYSYFEKYSFVIRKIISLWRHTKDSLRLLFIFPLDSILVWGQMFGYGVRQALVGK